MILRTTPNLGAFNCFSRLIQLIEMSFRSHPDTSKAAASASASKKPASLQVDTPTQRPGVSPVLEDPVMETILAKKVRCQINI